MFARDRGEFFFNVGLLIFIVAMHQHHPELEPWLLIGGLTAYASFASAQTRYLFQFMTVGCCVSWSNNAAAFLQQRTQQFASVAFSACPFLTINSNRRLFRDAKFRPAGAAPLGRVPILRSLSIS
jgi:hypothetical protein